MNKEEVKETERTLSRTRKASRVIDVLLKVLCGLLVTAALLITVFSVIGLLLPDVFPVVILDNGLTILSAIAGLLVVAAIVKIVSSIFSDIAKGESPFSMVQVKRLRWIAVLLFIDVLIALFVTPAVSPIMQIDEAAVLGVVNVANLGPSSIVRINLGEIVVAIAVYCASLVFQYGVLLQRYSDETL